MALQLQMEDDYGNIYPDGYRKFAFLHVDALGENIVLIFNNYKDQAARMDPTKKSFSQTVFRCYPNPIPAVLSYNGTGTLDETALTAMGITVVHGPSNPNTPDVPGPVLSLTHDGVTALDATALTAMGITIVNPAIPSYNTFAFGDSADPNGMGALVYNYAKSRPESAGAIDVIES